MPTRSLRLSALFLLLALGCGGQSTEYPGPPGLEVLTPDVGLPRGGVGAVIIRVEQSALIQVEYPWGGAVAGALRVEPGCPHRIPLVATNELAQGERAEVTLVAELAPGRRDEEVTFTAHGLGIVATGEVPAFEPQIITALGEQAIIASGHELSRVTVEGDLDSRSLDQPVRAMVSDIGGATVIVALEDAELQRLDAGLEVTSSFRLPGYEGSTPAQPIEQINTLHRTGQLIGAATDRGMSILDLSVEDPDPYCRARSVSTAQRMPADHNPTMGAVVVTSSERLIAVGDALNIYEPYDDTDHGGCEAFPGPMGNRGISVVTVPGDSEAAWGVIDMVLSGDRLWIHQGGESLLTLDAEVSLVSAAYLPDDELTRVIGQQAELTTLGDLAPSTDGQVWALASGGSCEPYGGLVRFNESGLALYIDRSTVRRGESALTAVDRSDDGRVWVVTDEGWATFIEP